MAIFTAPRILSTLALAAFILPAAAHATQPGAESPVAVVSTSGPDPAKPQDRAVLRHRIAVAAHKVCDQVAPGDPMTSSGYADCFSRTTADARSQLDSQVAIATSRAMVASIAPK